MLPQAKIKYLRREWSHLQVLKIGFRGCQISWAILLRRMGHFRKRRRRVLWLKHKSRNPKSIKLLHPRSLLKKQKKEINSKQGLVFIRTRFQTVALCKTVQSLKHRQKLISILITKQNKKPRK